MLDYYDSDVDEDYKQEESDKEEHVEDDDDSESEDTSEESDGSEDDYTVEKIGGGVDCRLKYKYDSDDYEQDED